MTRLKGDLGPLERAVMEVIWEAAGAEVTVRDVLRSRAGKGHAYTTMMTILDRLWHKGFLARRRAGRAYAYRVKRTREEHVEMLIDQVLAGAGDRHSALLGFVRGIDADDLSELRRVIRQVERERRNEA